LANCTSCGASNLGIARTDLVIIDGSWYCKRCLSAKGEIKCSKCGKQPFMSDEHFKIVDGEYLCTGCMEKMGITKKYDYIMASVMSKRPKPAARTVAQNDISVLGGMQALLEQNLEAGEQVEVAVMGNTGEGLACSSKHVFILKSGMASGSLTGNKCIKYPWNQISGIEIKEGALYGLIEIKGRGLESHDARNISKAKQAENAVTFLASKKHEFENALATLSSYVRG